MKCEHCEFTFNDGTYEYPCYVCKFFYDEPPEPFYAEDGCNLKYNEAEKLHKLLEKLESFRYDCDVYYNHYEEDNPKYTDKELKEIEKFNKDLEEAEKKYHDYYNLLVDRRLNK